MIAYLSVKVNVKLKQENIQGNHQQSLQTLMQWRITVPIESFLDVQTVVQVDHI